MKKIPLILICLLLYSPAEASDLTESVMFDKERGKVKYVTAQKSEDHAEVSFAIEKRIEDGIEYYYLLQRGEGNYDQFRDITWTKTAKLKDDGGMLQVLESKAVFKNKNGFPLAEYRKLYDHRSGVITFQSVNEKGNILKEHEFPIRGPTCDYITMPHFLKKFVANRSYPEYREFFLLSNEPKLYHVNIKELNQEVITLPFGQVEAVKFQLRANLGVLTDIVSRILPSTYIWYSTEYPHIWLQYKGLDSAPKSIHVKAFLVDRQGESKP